jgi:hypothetical protein
MMLAANGAAAFLLLAGCTETPGLPSGTYDHFQAFKQQPLHRAYALARAVNGSYTAVFVGNQSSAESAEAAAMARCREYASQKLYTDPSSCRIYAIDDTIVGTGTKIAPAGGSS